MKIFTLLLNALSTNDVAAVGEHGKFGLVVHADPAITAKLKLLAALGKETPIFSNTCRSETKSFLLCWGK